jgi:HlyD family secretion protein
MTTRNRYLLALLMATLLLLAGAYAWMRERADALPTDLHRANGRLELTRVDVVAKYPGRLVSVEIREGDRVEAGQVLATQEGDEFQAKLAQAQATLARALSEQARARSGLQVQAHKVALARLEWQQADSLRARQEISAVELERRRLALEAESAAQSAAGNQIATAGHAADEARAQIRLIETMLEGLKLRAPVAGRVEHRLAEPGAVLPPGGRVAALLDSLDVHLTVFFPSAVAAALKIGDEARIVLEGAAGRPLPATVAMVDADAQFTPKYVETVSERQNLVYRVKLRLPREVAREFEGLLKGGVIGDGYVRTSARSWPAPLQIGTR